MAALLRLKTIIEKTSIEETKWETVAETNTWTQCVLDWTKVEAMQPVHVFQNNIHKVCSHYTLLSLLSMNAKEESFT